MRTPPSWSWWRISMPSRSSRAPRLASATALGCRLRLNTARFVTTALTARDPEPEGDSAASTATAAAAAALRPEPIAHDGGMRRPEGCDLARERDGARCQGAPMMRAMMERARRPVRAAGSTRPSERGARFPRTRDDARFPVRSQRAFSRCPSSTPRALSIGAPTTADECPLWPPRRSSSPAPLLGFAAHAPACPLPAPRLPRPPSPLPRRPCPPLRVQARVLRPPGKGSPVAMVAAHSGLSWEGKDRDSFDWKTVKEPGSLRPVAPPLPPRRTRRRAVHRHRPRHRAPRRSRARLRRRRRLRRRLRHIRHAPRRGRGHLRRPPARQPTKFVPVGEGGKTDATHAELWADDGRFSLSRHLRCLEALIGPSGDAFTASGTTAGEMYLWGMLHQIAILDGSTFAATPGVDAFYRKIRDLPHERRPRGEVAHG